jgi:hypothetical protein
MVLGTYLPLAKGVILLTKSGKRASAYQLTSLREKSRETVITRSFVLLLGEETIGLEKKSVR